MFLVNTRGLFLWKIKKNITIPNGFEKILDKSRRRPKKIWVGNGIEMYSIHNKGISVVTERYIRILKKQIYKYMTSISKNVYIDTLNNIVDNKYQETIKMTLIDGNTSKYTDFVVESNDKDPKFKIGYHVIISK